MNLSLTPTTILIISAAILCSFATHAERPYERESFRGPEISRAHAASNFFTTASHPIAADILACFQHAVKAGGCQGFLDFLKNYGSNIPWEDCAGTLRFVPFSQIDHQSIGGLLNTSVTGSQVNHSLLYASLYHLFKFNVPFKLPSVDFIEKISNSPVTFDRELLGRYIDNMENRVYGLPPMPKDNPDCIGKQLATVVFHQEIFFIDIHDSHLSIDKMSVADHMAKCKVSTGSLSSGSKFICMTPSPYNVYKLSFTYCDTPSVAEFGVASPEEVDWEDGTTGTHIALHFLSDNRR